MSKILNIKSEITDGRYKGKTVEEILGINKKEIFNLIKQGFLFDDEVLSLAGIKKNVRDVKIEQVLVDHKKDSKIYEKETTSLSKILKEIHTIDNINEIIEAGDNDSLDNNDEFNEIDI